MTNSNTNSITE